MMGDVVFVAVVLLRFGVPLLIPRFPLPAIVAALVIDAADQTIFAAFDVEPENYQGYDKALDIFYLAMAYLSTLRNWPSEAAFRIGQFLWYYRLVGVLVFEFTEARALLLIFPNTFEYFFIAYEFVRSGWNPRRLDRTRLLAMAAVIWVVVKLPQETWIHILKLDFTEALSNHPWFGPTIIAVLTAVAAVLFVNRRRIPPHDWPTTFDVDAHDTTVLTRPVYRYGRLALVDHPLVEKTLLISLVSIVFSRILPEFEGSALGLSAGVAIIIVANSLITDRLFGANTSWSTTGREFAAVLAVNLGFMFLAGWLFNFEFAPGATGFFLLLLSLIAALYDRFRRLRIASMVQREDHDR